MQRCPWVPGNMCMAYVVVFCGYRGEDGSERGIKTGISILVRSDWTENGE